MNQPNRQPNQPNSAEELRAIREELTQFRKDFKKLNQELSLRIAFAIIGSIALLWIISTLIGLFVLHRSF